MSKEGFLQIKIAELENKLNKSSEKIEFLYNKLEKKETEINKLFKKVSPLIENYIDYEKLKEQATKIAEQKLEKEQLLFIKGMNKSIKKEVKYLLFDEVEPTMKRIKEKLNHDILSFFIHVDILRDYLVETAVIDYDKFMVYFKNNYDKIYNMRLKQGNMIHT
jgi:chromosome segregation ATPase